MKFEEAMMDIREYLDNQDDEYFEERGITREAVMADADQLSWCAREHMKCVEAYGVDRSWSCKDACDKVTGIVASVKRESLMCRCQRKGNTYITVVRFEDLKAGDTVYVQGIPHVLSSDAHYSGDADYDGYLAYDTHDDGIFPEDVDKMGG